MLVVAVIVSMCGAIMAAPQYSQSINNNQPLPNMFKALDVDSMVQSFDPKFVVIQDQRGEMPDGVHDALVKSLIADLHAVDVPVVYAQRHEIPIDQ